MAGQESKKRSGRKRFFKKIILRGLRFFKRYSVKRYAITFACCVVALFLFQVHLLDKVELILLDYRFRLKPSPPMNEEIVSIDIAQDSIEHLGRWPWDRNWHAGMITALKEFNARAVFYDVIFSEPTSDAYDAVMSESLTHAGNVYLPYVFNVEAMDSRRPITDDDIYGVDASIPQFALLAKGTGFINILPDPDGILRRVPLIIEYGGKRYLQAALCLACDLLGVAEGEIVVKKGKYIRLIVKGKEGIAARNIDIPIDANYQMMINWPSRWKESFKHFSFLDVLRSFSMVYKNQRPLIQPGFFKGKICVVGMSVSGLIDIKPTPLEPLYPAMGVNACVLDNILRSDFCRPADGVLTALLIILMAFFTTLLLSLYHPVRGLVSVVVLLSCFSAASIAVFLYFGLWVNITYPAFAMIFTYTGIMIYNEFRIMLEKKRFFDMAITDALTGLYQKSHFNTLMKSVFADRRSCRNKKGRMSLIIADIDHFKQINDTYGHLFGDVVLKNVARTIKSACRPLDICARYGGEEFIIMLPQTTIKEAVSFAERIRKAVEAKTFRYMKRSCKVTISLGVAELDQERNQQLLVQKADMALYQAKARGRNIVCRG
ncbi:MAG: diguanylate cyclase [Candidatus Omnitrophota bacterium]|jgi:diguanylate cyclase (GGDEF)-like protein